MTQISISQSLINNISDQQVCPYAIKLKYVDGVQTLPTQSMMMGNAFEYKLVGSTTNGEVVELPKLQKGGLSQPEKDLDEIVVLAKEVCAKMGVDLINGRRETIEVGTLKGQLDWITKDFLKPENDAIYDFKYTATRYDDKWDGWANFETKRDAQVQAIHYIYLYFKKYGKYVPFYFLIFGKSGWMRAIKIQITADTLETHQDRITYTGNRLIEFAKIDWKAWPTYEKCGACRVSEFCDKKQWLPDVEVYEL